MKTAILMYEKKYFSPFVSRVCELLGVENIFWLYENGVDDLCAASSLRQCNIRQIRKVLEEDCNGILRLVVFDVHLIPAIAGMRWTLQQAKKSNVSVEIVYIQHGTFNDLSSDKRIKTGLIWFSNSLFSLYLFMRTIRLALSGDFLSLAARSFWYGSFHIRSELVKYIPLIDEGVFWNRGDIEILGSQFLRVFRRTTLCQSPDKEKVDIQFNSNAPELYVAQPLVEDQIVPLETMSTFLSQLAHRSNVLILLHPRSDLVLFREFPREKLLRLSQLEKLEVSKVIGHYSSFLASLPVSVPLLLKDLGVPDVAASIRKFEASRSASASCGSVLSFSEALKRLNYNER